MDSTLLMAWIQGLLSLTWLALFFAFLLGPLRTWRGWRELSAFPVVLGGLILFTLGRIYDIFVWLPALHFRGAPFAARASPATELYWGLTVLLPALILLAGAWMAVPRLKVWHRANRLAAQDPLTGAFNRRKLEEEARRILSFHQRYQLQFLLFLIDLDGFKKINDLYGHRVGDRVLRTVAQQLKRNLRPYDLVVRYGGDEFVAIVQNTDPSLSATIGNRLIQSLRKSDYGIPEPIGLSIGAAWYPGDGTELAELLEAADRRLYYAKHRGGNQIALDDRLLAASLDPQQPNSIR